MIRYALLIEAANVPGCVNIPGPIADLELYKRWLSSDHGGAWYDYEINVLRCPSPTEVREQLRRANNAEYAFVAFSGHGHHLRYEATGREESRVLLKNAVEMPVTELIPSTARSTVVIDACRDVTVVKLTESYKRATAVHFQKSLPTSDVRARHRTRFDELVNECAAGPILMYSCSIGQIAGDAPQGGVFTFGLVDGAESWSSMASSPDDLRTNQAFTIASTYTKKERPGVQTPRYQGDRRLLHFPFGVVV